MLPMGSVSWPPALDPGLSCFELLLLFWKSVFSCFSVQLRIREARLRFFSLTYGLKEGVYLEARVTSAFLQLCRLRTGSFLGDFLEPLSQWFLVLRVITLESFAHQLGWEAALGPLTQG